MNFKHIFNETGALEFSALALKIFRYQSINNLSYKRFLELLKVDIEAVQTITDIPFLPIEFFKSHDIVISGSSIQEIFESSGTTGTVRSRHLVTDLKIYEKSFVKGFEHFYGKINEYTILALLPNYLERKSSSLVYMVDHMIEKSNSKYSGFYLHNLNELGEKLAKLDASGEKILLIGVSYALLDLVEQRRFVLKNTIIMETGGMKGRRKEMVRKELHALLTQGFGVDRIHSEYGMTELLSQAYSKGAGIFKTPPWMKVFTRDTEDPFQELPIGFTGGINIIDLANVNSCSFIATQDLGKKTDDDSFEILGRFDHSDIRGCNLMID